MLAVCQAQPQTLGSQRRAPEELPFWYVRRGDQTLGLTHLVARRGEHLSTGTEIRGPRGAIRALSFCPYLDNSFLKPKINDQTRATGAEFPTVWSADPTCVEGRRVLGPLPDLLSQTPRGAAQGSAFYTNALRNPRKSRSH